jgi:site-specific recombinase XerC
VGELADGYADEVSIDEAKGWVGDVKEVRVITSGSDRLVLAQIDNETVDRDGRTSPAKYGFFSCRERCADPTEPPAQPGVATRPTAAGLPEKLRIHDLHHSHAPILIHAGTDVKAAQARLGHGSPSITLDAY